MRNFRRLLLSREDLVSLLTEEIINHLAIIRGEDSTKFEEFKMYAIGREFDRILFRETYSLIKTKREIILQFEYHKKFYEEFYAKKLENKEPKSLV